MQNNGWAGKDERAPRTHYSIACLMRGRDRFILNRNCSSRLFFTCSGEFDIYVGKRGSSPVLNRISNPAFHWVLARTGSDFSAPEGRTRIDFGLEHESDGQTTEVGSPAERQLTADL